MAAVTRAELLARCQAAGLHATAWRKERMEQELQRLDGAPAPEPAEAEDEKPQRPAPRRSGWCGSWVPMWSLQHAQPDGSGCPLAGSCSCECHEPGWEPPPVPAGARMSKFDPRNPDHEPPPARQLRRPQSAI